MARPKRQEYTREELEREDDWREPSQLDMPPAPDGVIYRWIRVQIRGEDDIKNIVARKQEGYDFVTKEELPPEWQHMPSFEDGRSKGYVGVGDLALMKISEAQALRRKRHYEKRARDQEIAVEIQLGKLHDSRMPVSNESTSKVSKGRKAQFD